MRSSAGSERDADVDDEACDEAFDEAFDEAADDMPASVGRGSGQCVIAAARPSAKTAVPTTAIPKRTRSQRSTIRHSRAGGSND